MEKLLSNLVLDYWYKVLMAVGILVFISTASGLLPKLPTAPSLLISMGVFFWGLGEWINHPLQTGLMPATAYMPAGVVTSHPRNVRPIGVIFDLVGFVLLAVGLYRLF